MSLGHTLRAGTIPCGRFIDDSDRHGIIDALDNCLSAPNPDQSDLDSDGLGDLRDPDKEFYQQGPLSWQQAAKLLARAALSDCGKRSGRP